MVLERRLRCHCCGTKQPHAQRTISFECDTCGATNFLDGKGHIIDAPISATSKTPNMIRFAVQASFPQDQQQEQIFCERCAQNQHIYNEMLANYLPDEDDPRYRECEKRLPQFKADLEKRYPLVCVKCAPIAQKQIRQADYYGMSQNAARLCANTRVRGGSTQMGARDSALKRIARTLLALVRMTVYTGLGVQVVYHIYTAFYLWRGTMERYNDFSLASCAIRTLLMRFDLPCRERIGHYVPQSLTLAVVLLPYNTGHNHWFDGSMRVEAVTGQRNYFFMQLILLFARYCAWNLRTGATWMKSSNREHVVAIHIFAAAFFPFAQWLAETTIQPVKWKLSGTMMPDPKDQDVLGAFAGPSQEECAPTAAANNIFPYPRGSQLDSTITSRAPTQKPTSFHRPYPSPGISDDGDAMETDFEPRMRSQPRGSPLQKHNTEPTHTYYNHGNASPLGFGKMRNQLVQVEQQYQDEQQRATEEKQGRYRYAHDSFAIPPQATQQYSSVFSRPVPPAPVSIERQYRSPWVSQRPAVSAPAPISQQKDFMERMRAGVQPITMTGPNSEFQLQKGKLHIASDNKETGLEDSFGNHFSFNEPGPDNINDKASGWFGGFLR